MRVGPPIISPWTAAFSAQLSQSVGQAASHRSSPTQRPVEPVHAIQDGVTVRRVNTHTFDIRV